jgi:hypothetical protein
VHTDSFRLLVIEPAKKGEPVRCCLELHRLSESPTYEAISYAWGDGLREHTIFIDDTTFSIGQNLYDALQRFRHERRPRVLWADAICLNQNDNTERNHQVRLMRHIYEKSALTLIWLGEAYEADLPCLELLSHYEAALPKSLVWPFSVTSPNSESALVHKCKTAHDFKQQVDSIKVFEKKLWPRRIWVLQEFAVSRKSRIFCGAYSCRPPVFAIMMQDVFTSFSKLRLLEQFGYYRNYIMLRFQIFAQMWQNHRSGKLMKLGELLFATFGHFEASDPRDKVFALIGLLEKNRHEDLIDYHLTTKEVFTKTMTQCLLEDGTPYPLLSLVGSLPSGETRETIPSWVPDFSCHRHFRLSFSSFSTFSAAGHSPPVVCVIGDTLSLVGIIVDEVRQTLDCSTSYFESDWTVFRKWYGKCRSLMDQESICYDEESPDNTWWRVMVCDLHSTWNGAKSSWMEDAFTWNRASVGFNAQYLEEEICAPCWEDQATYSSNLVVQERQLQYQDILLRTSASWNFCTTDRGKIGWIPCNAQTEDKICIFSGSRAPFIIRKREDGCYSLIGDAYIHGIMHGEAVEEDIAHWEDIQLR